MASRFVYLVGENKTLTYYMASFIETTIGPRGNRTRVLRMENLADDPDRQSTSRNEYSFFMKAPPREYREGYVKYWMKLQGNLGDLLPNNKETFWYVIVEWKEPNSGNRKSAARQAIFEERFDHPNVPLPEGWWCEGDAAEIRDGRLHVNADSGRFRQSTIWLDHTFTGDLRVEYDACVLASADVANNLSFFFLYSDPSGTPLYESRKARADGSYARYHGLNGYIFTNVANGEEAPARVRFRDGPGFNLAAESRQYENRRGKVYHVAVERKGNRFTYTVDGRTLLEAVDDRFNPAHEVGLIGFRTWHTELWWDKIVVTRP